jgi:FkbM family methyltransferase
VSFVDTLRFILNHPLNRGGKMRALGRLLHWQLATRISGRPVRFAFVEDTFFVAGRGMTGASGNFYCGMHEPEDMAFVLHYLRPGDVFYDVGANVGSYSMLAAVAGARVHAFEPSPGTASILRRNIDANRLDGRVVVHECALGSESGEAIMSRETDTTNHILAEGEAAGCTDRVAVQTLDSIFDDQFSSIVKIDVEGFESEVLKGSTLALASPSLRGVLMENNGRDKRYGAGRTAVELMKSRGFCSCRYDPHSRTLEAAPPQRGGNVLFLRNPDEAQARVRAGKKFKLVNGWI